MKTLLPWAISAVLAIVAIALILIPIHVQMTGVVLLLLVLTYVIYRFLTQRAINGESLLAQLLVITASFCVILLMTAMCLVADGGNHENSSTTLPDYAIVLGANVNSNGAPSEILQARLNEAVRLYSEHPNITFILSGGQGIDEPCSEAECMARYMVLHGVPEKQLLLESISHSTRENLTNSLAILQALQVQSPRIILITSEFHMKRALYSATVYGLEPVGVCAETRNWFFRVNYTLREIFAFIKTFLMI